MGSDNAIELRRGIEAARDELIVLHRHYRDSLGLEPSANLVAMWLDDLLKNPQLAPLPWLRAEEIKENGWYRIATPARYFGEMYIEVDGDELFCCLGVDYDLSFLPDVIDDAARFRGPIATPELPVPELPKEESK